MTEFSKENPYFPYSYTGDKKKSQDKKYEEHRRTLSKFVEGKEIRDCKYACGTRLYYEDLSDAWREFKTNIHHGFRRCKQVKEQRTAEINNKNSRFREHVIEMIQILIQTKVPKKASKEEEMYIILNNMSQDEQPTVYELVSAIYPDQVSIDVNGRKIVTENGLQRIYNTLHRIRKNPENQSFVPFSRRNKKTGNFHYTDIQTEDDFEPVETRLTDSANGSLESVDKFKKIVQTDPEIRERAKETLEAYFESKRTVTLGDNSKKKDKKQSNNSDDNDNKDNNNSD